MLCRVADEIFWMSRYAERAVAASRLVDVTLHLELDAGDVDDEAELWEPLLGPAYALDVGSNVSPGTGWTPTSRDVRHYLAFDMEHSSSIVSCIRKAREAARGVRESISSEMWEQVNTLYLALVETDVPGQAEDDPHAFYRRVREGAQFFQGLADSTLAHGEEWQFFSLGMYLERADNVALALNRQSHLLSLSAGSMPGEELVRWLAVLRSCGAAEAYARFYSLRVEPARVVEFLLLNPIFPQSVRFCLHAAREALREIAGERTSTGRGVANPAVRSLGLLQAELEHAAVDELLEPGLRPYLDGLQLRIGEVTEAITRAYLRSEVQPGRHVAAERAALIMAAQQQQ